MRFWVHMYVLQPLPLVARSPSLISPGEESTRLAFACRGFVLAVELVCEAAQKKKNAAKYLYFCSVLNRENDTDTAGDVNMQ